jgi:hypothetical protein
MRNEEGKTVTQHAQRQAPGATAGEAAGEGPTPSTTVQDPRPIHDTCSRPDTRQTTGDSGDTAQQHHMPLGTPCGIFIRLRYSTEDDAIDNISLERQDQRKQEKHADAKDN